jgi:orotidine-5'-phosphate decarboxylase
VDSPSEENAGFADRLQAAVEDKDTPCLVGLDPHLELLPPEFASARDLALPRSARAELLGNFLCQVIELVAPLVPAVKPQSAFFEALGADGVLQWERVLREARRAGLIVIGDVKRGDVASTAQAYATAFLEGAGERDAGARCDAVTLNPFLGADSIAPFLETCRRVRAGVFVLVRTSNPGGADLQRHGEPELSAVIADLVARWGSELPELTGECGLSGVGAVVGATHPAELRQFRERMPRSILLLPGYGAQGAKAEDLIEAFLPGRAPRGALVNSSRGITAAWREPRFAGRSWRDATRAATLEMIARMRKVLRAR